MSLHSFLSLDLPPLLTAVFASLACALLGNFLLLRRLSLMGDAISHSVLPGLIGGFIVVGSRGTLPMFLGAAGAGLATVILIELVRRLGGVEPGAAMGVVFSVLFALGVVLVSVYARHIDLDPDCVLNGILETIIWPQAPHAWSSLLAPEALGSIPRQVPTTMAMALLAALFVTLLFKELRITAFDPALASALGLNAPLVHALLMVLTAGAVVASFEAVGSILVIAMLILPAATARLLTDRLVTQVWLSAVIAVATAAGGYFAGAHAPAWLAPRALSAAGMITVFAGLLLVGAIMLAPTHGVLARSLRRTALSLSIAREDLLAMLYRVEESAHSPGFALDTSHALGALAPTARPLIARLAIRSAVGRGLTGRSAAGLVLTTSGRDAARRLVRSHRLWETYLVRELGLRPDHVHRTAMDLEHLTSPAIQDELLVADAAPTVDPQGKPIPGP